jgi:hypothetical protein
MAMGTEAGAGEHGERLGPATAVWTLFNERYEMAGAQRHESDTPQEGLIYDRIVVAPIDKAPWAPNALIT